MRFKISLNLQIRDSFRFYGNHDKPYTCNISTIFNMEQTAKIPLHRRISDTSSAFIAFRRIRSGRKSCKTPIIDLSMVMATKDLEKTLAPFIQTDLTHRCEPHYVPSMSHTSRFFHTGKPRAREALHAWIDTMHRDFYDATHVIQKRQIKWNVIFFKLK